jgi:hypothetical protein
MRCRVEAAIQARAGYTRCYILIFPPDAMLLSTDECFAQEIPEPVYDGLTFPKYALWDSNPGSRLAKEQKSRFALEVGGYCSIQPIPQGTSSRLSLMVEAQ